MSNSQTKPSHTTPFAIFKRTDQTKSKPSFYHLLTGKSSRKFQLIYIWTVFLFLTAISIIAQIMYPGEFSLWSNTISEQGSPSLNPIGSIIWRIGVIFNGIAHIPHLLYIEFHLKKYNIIKAKWVRNIGIIAALGFSFIGFIPMDSGLIHDIIALIAFWGYYFAAIISFNILNKELNKEKVNQKVRKKIFRFSKGFSIYFNCSGALCLASFMFNSFFTYNDVWPPAEWNYLIAICLWLLFWPPIVKTLE
jgi:hypothetical protein